MSYPPPFPCETCGEKIGGYCNEYGQELTCGECMASCCEKCVGVYEPDASAEGDPSEYRDCSKIRCVACRDEEIKEDAVEEPSGLSDYARGFNAGMLLAIFLTATASILTCVLR